MVIICETLWPEGGSASYGAFGTQRCMRGEYDTTEAYPLVNLFGFDNDIFWLK
jgi:hypothetical protein